MMHRDPGSGVPTATAAKHPERHLDALHRLASATIRARDVEAIYAEALDVLADAVRTA